MAEHVDYSAGRDAFRDALRQARADALTFKPKLSGSEWADRHAIIPAGTSAETGRIKLYGYQRGLLDAMCDPKVPRITVLKAARVGYTRLATIATAYHLEHEATLCAIAQPTLEDAADFARSEIGPMLRDTPALARLIRPLKKGEGQDTITDITLGNGSVLRVRGARSDDAFRRYSARFMVADEYDADGWAPGARSQGDKLTLFWTRGETFWNRKLVVGSTPLLEDTSRTWREWGKSSQSRYFVPCPSCSETDGELSGWQYLEWTDRETPWGLKWETDEHGRVVDAFYVCKHCGSIIAESHKHWMDAHGEWRATNPDAEEGHLGFHLWTAMSLTPNAGWRIIVSEYLKATKAPADLMQPFYNLRLGRTFAPTYGQELKISQFIDRLEEYPAEVPHRSIRFLVAGCDVQGSAGKDPRIEASIYGVGFKGEMWLIGHFVLRGDPSRPEVWDELDVLLQRPFKGLDGRLYFVQAACVDSSDGNHTTDVLHFTDARKARRVWAIKGRSERNGQRNRIWPRRPSVKGTSVFYMIGGNALRDHVYRALPIDKPGPRCIHFPQNPPSGANPCDDVFFKQLTEEKPVARRGFIEWNKNSGGAKEGGVCLLYSWAAVEGLRALSARWDVNSEGAEIVAEKTDNPEKNAEKTPEAPENQAKHADGPEPEKPVAVGNGRSQITQRGRPQNNWLGRRGGWLK